MLCYLEFRIREKSKATSNEVFTKALQFFPTGCCLWKSKGISSSWVTVDVYSWWKKSTNKECTRHSLQKSNVH